MKKYRLQIILGPIFLFLVLYLFPILFSFEYMKPLRHALSDFDITDLGIQLGQTDEVKFSDEIVVINTQEFNKKKLYYVLEEILYSNPKVIGILDVVTEKGYTEYNEKIRELFDDFQNVVFASELKYFNPNYDAYTSINRSWGGFLLKTHTGYTNISYGLDKRYNTVRTFRPLVKAGGEKEYSFAVKVASQYNPKAVERLIERDYKTEIIDYTINRKSVYHLSAAQVLQGEYAEDLFEDKIILIGMAPFDSPTKYLDHMCFTPLSKSDDGKPLPDMYEIEVQANIINMILNESYYSQLSEFIIILLTIIVVYLNFIAFYYIAVNIQLWYEILSNLLFLIQSILILVLIIFLYNSYRVYADFTIALFALAMMIIIFEAYMDSVVPVTRSIIKFINTRGVK